jgi:protein phosphatase 2C-like protein
MKVLMATSAGHDRPNEDFVGAVPGAVVLLDGAGIPGSEAVCSHGVAWYAHTLGATILGHLSREPARDLAAALADAIEQVAGQHRHTCDLASPISPQATAAIVRCSQDRVDFLVLADVFVVLDSSESRPQVLTDPREVDARNDVSTRLEGLTAGTPEYERAMRSATEELRARRNQPGGYWIAKEDPEAAAQAVTGSVPLGQLRGAALLSNGASRIVDPYRLAEWPAVLELIRAEGPDELIRRVRKAEPEADRPDDATVAFCDLRMPY